MAEIVNDSEAPTLGRLYAEKRGFPTSVSGDRLFHSTTLVMALIVLGLLIAVAAVLVWSARESIARFGLHFLVSSEWDPVNDQFGALPFIYGTVVSSALALAIAVPLSLGVALCLNEMVPRWLSSPLGFMVELLAAIPSVVYGLWGIFALGPFLRDNV